MKKTIILIMGLFFGSFGFAATPGQQLQNLLNSVHSMQGNFTQKNYRGSGRLMQSLKGNMAIKKPGRFRWNITSPSPVIMVSNGKVVWIYDKRLKQVSINKVKKNKGSSPAMVLSNRIRLLSNYFTVWKKGTWYILNPRYSNDMLKQVQMRFSGNRLTQMWILDKLGQRAKLTFSGVRVNRRLSNSQFTFRVPKGVDVVR